MSATRDKLFDFMNRVIDGEKITLNAETKVISIILGIDYNAFLSRDREYFAHNDFKDELMHQYERYLDLYKLKGKRFDELDTDSRHFVLSSFIAGSLALKEDKVVPFCRYAILINMLGGLYIQGSIVHTCDNSEDEGKLHKFHTMMMPDNDSIISEMD